MKKIDREQIKKQAKKIMDEFVSALEKAEQVKEEFGVRRKDVTRVPGKDKYKGSDFKEKVLKNAPKTEDDFIIAEKKKW
ncbi:Asp-tRNA(Asn) amidotransferase GatCAB subunit C [Candidatus Woesearchaeota archaeon]|nr:Asp-tRNA(Asn) amidotransferase GatCAB subunit C [Candidatus Woesearchaeota archaeon]